MTQPDQPNDRPLSDSPSPATPPNAIPPTAGTPTVGAPAGTPVNYAGTGAGAPPTQDERNLALLSHLTGIFTSFVGPLIIWLMKKDSSPYISDQAKEALNFQITVAIGYLIAGAATFICIGPLIALALWIASLVLGIMATMAASRGELYRYPMTLRLVN